MLVTVGLVAVVVGFAAPASAQWPSLSPPAVAGDGVHDIAVLVAIEDYAFAPDVPGALENARDWYTFLVKGRRVPYGRVKLLRNNQATLEVIQAQIAWAAEHADPRGTLWFLFIGHGAPSRSGEDGVLVGADAQQTAIQLYARSLPRESLMTAIGKGKQGQSVVVLDACFSGRTSTGSVLAKGLQPFLAIKAPPAKSATVLLTAGAGNEFAGPLPGAERPAFSYLLLGALRGWGDANGDRQVTAREAVTYTSSVLSALVMSRTQTPQLTARNDNLVLARGGAEAGPDIAAMVAGGMAPPPAVTPSPVSPTPTRVTPKPAPPPVRDFDAAMKHKEANLDVAVEYYRRCTTADPTMRDCHAKLAVVLLANEQPCDAVAHMKRYLELFPTDRKEAPRFRRLIPALSRGCP